MEPKHIKMLLDKYWLAETSLEEEAELRAYFKNTDPKEQEVAALFQYFETEQGSKAGVEWSAPLETQLQRKPASRIWNNKYLQAAAAVLLIASILLFTILNKPEKAKVVSDVDTYRDPQVALIEAKKSLLLISENLNKGKQYTLELQQVEKVEQLLKQKIQP